MNEQNREQYQYIERWTSYDQKCIHRGYSKSIEDKNKTRDSTELNHIYIIMIVNVLL